MAHTKSVAAALSKLFENREVEKRYRALVSGDFSDQPKLLRIEQPIDDKSAISEVSMQSVDTEAGRSLVDVRIETGRKHQIRRHLEALGHPVIGDRLYGSGEKDGVDLQLTARYLAFLCPVNNERVEYELSSDWLPTL